MLELVVLVGPLQLDDARDQNRVAPGCGVDVGDLEGGERDPARAIGYEVFAAAVQTPAGMAYGVIPVPLRW